MRSAPVALAAFLALGTLAAPAAGQVPEPSLTVWADTSAAEPLAVGETLEAVLEVHVACHLPGRLPGGVLHLDLFSAHGVLLEGPATVSLPPRMCPGAAHHALPIRITAVESPRLASPEAWVFAKLAFDDPLADDVQAPPAAIPVHLEPVEDENPAAEAAPSPVRQAAWIDSGQVVAGFALLVAGLLGYGEHRRRSA